MHSVRRFRSRRRAVSPVIAAILLTGMTVAAGVVLWTFKIQTPQGSVSVEYVAEGGQSEPAWGDPTDCNSTGIYASCNALPAFFIIFTAHSPESLLLTDLTFGINCNQTSLLAGTFAAMKVVPGTGANPGSGAPKLGNCGSWSPSPHGTTATYFNRLAYFQQIFTGSAVLKNGDIFVVYEHPLANFCDRSGHCPDDDYHGAPPWCFTVPGACTITIAYTGQPRTQVAIIPITTIGLS